MNRIPIFIIDPTILKDILKEKLNQNENQRGDYCHFCLKSLITIGVLESNLTPDGLNARVCSHHFIQAPLPLP